MPISRIGTDGIEAGAVAPSDLSTGAPSWDGSGNLSFNSGYGSNGVAYACRAWVSFIGSGTVTIRASGNVSSITDNGQGDYTVNFTTAMPDVNYAAQISTWYGSDSLTSLVAACGLKRGQAPTTTTVRVQVANAVWNNAAATDVDGNYVAIFR